MGLDTHIYKIKRPTADEEVYNKLVGERQETTEVLYWRKVWGIVEFFGDILETTIENCDEYEIGEIELRKLLNALEQREISYGEFNDDDDIENDISKIKKLLDETDFSVTKFIFSNWW